jgi:pimeloyl-ACP methyl ester carboxylesterase
VVGFFPIHPISTDFNNASSTSNRFARWKPTGRLNPLGSWSVVMSAGLAPRRVSLCFSRAYGGRRPREFSVWFGVVTIVGSLLGGGCVSNDYLSVRPVPQNPLADSLQLFSWRGPRPTPRTEQLLRQYNLAEQERRQPPVALASLEQIVIESPTPDAVHGSAELAYLNGQRAQRGGRDLEALEYFAAALGHACGYLFDRRLDDTRNPYDPQFRQVCDLYNGALEAALRIMNERGQLKPGTTQSIRTAERTIQVAIEGRGPWPAEEIERLEFVSDYQIDGLTNHYRTYGLGVPLIAVRRASARGTPAGQSSESPVRLTGANGFYPPKLSFPVTAFLRVRRSVEGVAPASVEAATPAPRFVLELLDPLATQRVAVGERLVPLETDLSTPLAHFLQGMPSETLLATSVLRYTPAAQRVSRVYLLEPFDPRKIPVILVHGLWSSPMTWMEMFNDLRAVPELRERYQFWFYLYPTGQPFWVSAADFRDDLREVQQTLDPDNASAPLQRMVLVGHSMGGLVSMMQTLEMGDRVWRLVSDKPFAELKADPAVKDELSRIAFFAPNRSVARVVTIGTPHHGSKFANEYTQWLGQKLIDMPFKLANNFRGLERDNPGYFRSSDLLSIRTSIDSLAPDCPLFRVLEGTPRAPWVKYHNIVGLLEEGGVLRRIAGAGDGIVPFRSAQLADVESEVVVPATHTFVHRHPQSILTVRELLFAHMAETPTEVATEMATGAVNGAASEAASGAVSP